MQHWHRIFTIGLTALLLVACGGNAPANSDAESTPPTAEVPVESDTAEAAAGDDEPVEFTAEGAAGSTLSVMYPPGWLTGGNADDGILISTSPDASLATGLIPPGEATLSVQVMRQELLDAMQIEANTEAADVLTRFLDFMGNGEGERATPVLGEIQERMIGAGNGAYAAGSSEQMDMLIIIMPLGDEYILVSAMTGSEELSDYEDILFSIAESVVYLPGE